MATIGQRLSTPEEGWVRHHFSDPAIEYIGTGWTTATLTHGDMKYTQTISGTMIKFEFVGTRLRFIGVTNTTHSTVMNIKINGVTETFSARGVEVHQCLQYEKTGLPLGRHTVEITSSNSYGPRIHAIDVGEDEHLFVPLGRQMTIPQVGWKRYDDSDPSIRKDGYLTAAATGGSNGVAYNGSYSYTAATNNPIEFTFRGKNLRIIARRYSSWYSDQMELVVDGQVVQEFSYIGVTQDQTLLAEVLDLTEGVHNAVIRVKSGGTGGVSLDAIDLDSNGRLLHPDEVTDIGELEVGKRIRCHYQATITNQVGNFSGLGEETSPLMPTLSSATPRGDFYFIMVEDWDGEKRLIADRNLQHSISWDALNAAGIATGLQIPLYRRVNEVITATTPKVTASTYTGAFEPWKAFNGVGGATNEGWAVYILQPVNFLQIEFDSPIEFDSYTILCDHANLNRYPKTWTLKGSNDGITWDTLDSQKGIEGWVNGTKKVFKLEQSAQYKHGRLEVTESGDGAYIVITELEFTKVKEDVGEATLRLLTGGISATDKDNEWDKYIVNSDLDGTIAPGDGNVWNWSTVYSWVSTTVGATPNTRVLRGATAVGTWTPPSAGGSGATTTTTGFRPMLLLVGGVVQKFLFSDGRDIKTYTSGEWVTVGTQNVTQEMFDEYGMRSLHVLSRGETIVTRPMQEKGQVGEGRVFSYELDLEKIKQITSLRIN